MRADRLLAIILLLQARGKLTTRTLARELEVSRRTILRDVDALCAAGVPLYAEGGHGGGVTLDPQYRVSLSGLTEAEVRALFVSGSRRLLDDLGLGRAAESTQRKLLSALPAPHQPSVDHMRQRIYIDTLWWWHDDQPAACLAALQQAVYEDRVVDALYETYAGEVAERVLEPYSLVAKSSNWYLLARHDGALRLYRVARFHRVTLREERFARDPDFDLERHWQTHLQQFARELAGYEFKLHVHESRLNFVRWLSPGRWQVLSPADEEGWLMVQVQLDSLELAKMLVFGLGRQAVVLEPAELREAALAQARELLEAAGAPAPSKGR